MLSFKQYFEESIDVDAVGKRADEIMLNLSTEERYNSGTWRKGKKDPSFEEYNLYLYENKNYGFIMMKDESRYSDATTWHIVGEYDVDAGPDYNIIDDYEYEDTGESSKKNAMEYLSERSMKDWAIAQAFREVMLKQQ